MWYRLDKNITAVILLAFVFALATALVAKLWVEPAYSGTGSIPFWLYSSGKSLTLTAGIVNFLLLFPALIALYCYPIPKPAFVFVRPALPFLGIICFFIGTGAYTGQGTLAYDFSTPDHAYRIESLIDYNGVMGAYALNNKLQVKLWECDSGGEWCSVKESYKWDNLPPPDKGKPLYEFDKYQKQVLITVGGEQFGKFNLP
ncbi:hypothetical protein [Candidatus Chlorohelix sp.]|uniref:hypothetical protein n=1 Tax=Candidatus Chlorohelix sp. TaxID=3139201 RepID=UPI003062B854